MSKTCKKCGVTKSTDDFYFARLVYKQCKKESSIERYPLTKDKAYACKKAWREINKQKNTVLIVNDNCKYCNHKFKNYFDSQACIDHNHETGEVRGILCKTCNIKLGVYEKNKLLFDKYIRVK